MVAVILKDVSKQTIEDLIKFIYCGEVKVTQSTFNEFINTAKALKIKGLADGRYERAFDLQTSQSVRSAHAHNGLQYQSSQTVQVQRSANAELAKFKYDLNPTNIFQTHNDDYEMAMSFDSGSYGNDMDNVGASMDLKFDVQDDKCKHNVGNGSIETPTTANVPKAKRLKRGE